MSKKALFSRRLFVKASLQLAAGIALSRPLEGLAALTKRPISFHHTHTGERLTIPYSLNGCRPADLAKLNTFLRDFRTGEIHPIDPALLDIIYGIQLKSGNMGTIEIISGFRSPRTNEYLRSRSSGVSRKSLHMNGQALDIRIKDLKTEDLRDVAISMQLGGVGYYAQSDFVHIDTGRFRTW